MAKKILFSPGYGAGWSTWADPDYRELVLTWAPLIRAVEAGETITANHPAVISLVDQVPNFHTGGCGRLKVVTITKPCRIAEYDGYETVEYLDEFDDVVYP